MLTDDSFYVLSGEISAVTDSTNPSQSPGNLTEHRILGQVHFTHCARTWYAVDVIAAEFVPEAIVTSGGATQGAFSAEAAVR